MWWIMMSGMYNCRKQVVTAVCALLRVCASLVTGSMSL